jgi:hypothetical protein
LVLLFKQKINVVGDLILFHHVKEIVDRTLNYVKLVSLQVWLPMFWNDIIEDIFSLILHEMLIGSKWREPIMIIVEFNPPGAKLTNCLITCLSEETRGCAYKFSVWAEDCQQGTHVP